MQRFWVTSAMEHFHQTSPVVHLSTDIPMEINAAFIGTAGSAHDIADGGHAVVRMETTPFSKCILQHQSQNAMPGTPGCMQCAPGGHDETLK